MDARSGDRLRVHGRTLGQPTREGTVTEVRGSAGEPMLRMRWDDGTESIFMPTLGVAEIIGRDEGAPPSSGQDEISIHTDVSIALTETEGECRATATLATLQRTFTGEGRARRRSGDPSVPMIGEELAIGRALMALGAQLTGAAGTALAEHEDRPIHLLET